MDTQVQSYSGAVPAEIPYFHIRSKLFGNHVGLPHYRSMPCLCRPLCLSWQHFLLCLKFLTLGSIHPSNLLFSLLPRLGFWRSPEDVACVCFQTCGGVREISLHRKACQWVTMWTLWCSLKHGAYREWQRSPLRPFVGTNMTVAEPWSDRYRCCSRAPSGQAKLCNWSPPVKQW